MRVVVDTDMLSIFERINRLDILQSLFEEIIIPRSVISELNAGEIKTNYLNSQAVKLTRTELLALRKIDMRLGRGERECLAIAKYRNVPLASNDKLVHLVCKEEGVYYFSLPRLLRLAISKKILTREEGRTLIGVIEQSERTVIKDSREIFK